MSRSKLVFVIFTCLAIIIWVGTEILRTPPSDTVSSTIQDELEPIDPSFDQNMLGRLQQTIHQLPKQQARIITAASASAQISPVVNPSPTLRPQTSSSSAILKP